MPSLPSAADLLRRLTGQRGAHPDASYALLVLHGIAYGRIPKAGNSFMRRRLAKAAGLARRPGINRDAVWADPTWLDIDLLTGSALAARAPTYVFTVVRNPFDRLVSCWRNKIMQDGATPLGPPFVKGMAFETFVERVADLPDRGLDVHVRSQTSLLFAGGRPPTLDVYRLERLDAEWPRLSAAWAACGLRLGAPRTHEAATTTKPFRWPPVAVDLVRRRYAADFATFYPDARDPAAEA